MTKDRKKVILSEHLDHIRFLALAEIDHSPCNDGPLVLLMNIISNFHKLEMEYEDVLQKYAKKESTKKKDHKKVPDRNKISQ